MQLYRPVSGLKMGHGKPKMLVSASNVASIIQAPRCDAIVCRTHLRLFRDHASVRLPGVLQIGKNSRVWHIQAF